MDSVAEGLRELHRLLSQQREAREKLEHAPRQIRARQQLASKAEAERDACKERLTTLRKRGDEKSLQLKTNEAKITELKVKLNSAASNREYEILQGQIDADTMANSVLEDEILDAYEQVDQAQQEFAASEKKVEEAKAQEKRVAEELKAAEPGLLAEIAELDKSVKEAEKVIPAKIFDQYRRMVSAYGDNALASIEGDACSNCYVSLSPQTQVEVRSGKVTLCTTCGRLLYAPEGG